ncbi:YlxQ family RNA-binding protein [Salinithrix halophila]
MDKLYQLLGLATRAGKLVSGEEQVLKVIRSGKAHLVLLTEDASPNAKKKIADKCSTYQVPLSIVGSRQMLGRAVGKVERVVIAVTDPGFSKSMRNRIQVIDGGERFVEDPSLRVRKKNEYEQQRSHHHPKKNEHVGQQPHERDG